MTILYLHQYFKTPIESGSTRSYWISRKLLENDIKVIMITAKNNLNQNFEEKEIDGIRVIYLKVDYNQNMGVFLRFLSFLKYMAKVCFWVFKLRKVYDKIYATSTPLSVGVPALIANKILGKPYIFEVRDLWPEVPIQMGAVRNRLIIRILKKFEMAIYLNAHKIIALSPGMEKGISNLGIESEKILMVPNMSKPHEFFPRQHNFEIKKKFNITSEFINIIYFGAIGKSNGLMDVIKNFNKIGNDRFRLYIAGEGSEKEKIDREIIQSDISNVFLIGEQPMALISELVNCCDISLVCFQDLPILATNSPNKLFDSLSAGKPIIVNSSGWTKTLVEDNNCGFYYNPQNYESLKALLNFIEQNRSILIEMGVNARKLSLENYDREILTRKIVDVV